MKHLLTILILLGTAFYSAAQAAPLASKQPLTEQQQQDEQAFTYYLYAAQQALDASQYDDALSLSEFAWRIKPQDPAICHFLGILYEGLGRHNDALARYQTAYKGSPDDYWYRYFSLLYRLSGESSTTPSEKVKNDYARRARQVITTEAKRQSDNTDVLDAYQQLLLSEGKYTQALQVQNKIEKIEGRSPYNVLKRYRILIMQGKVKDAIAVVENYCKEEPDDYYFQALRGDIYLAQGKEEQALALYYRALQDNPDNTYVLQSLNRYYQQQGDALSQRNILARLIEVAPSDDILKQYFDLLTADTTVTNEEQIAFVQKAYLMEPNSARWHYYWGLALVQQDSLNDALQVLQEGIALGAKDPVTRFSMHVLSGDLYMRLNQLDSCFSHYERALALDPENVYVLNNYAYTLATNGGDLKKAEKMSQKTIEKEPNNPTFLDTYAWILHLQGQDSLARFYMKRVMEKAGNAADQEELMNHYRILFNEQNQSDNETK